MQRYAECSSQFAVKHVLRYCSGVVCGHAVCKQVWYRKTLNPKPLFLCCQASTENNKKELEFKEDGQELLQG